MKNQPPVRSLRFRVGLFILAWVLVFIGFVIYRTSNGFIDDNPTLTKAQLSGLRTTLLDYQKTCGSFPTTDQGLGALVLKPNHAPECMNYPKDAFLLDGKVPRDPWANEFVYASDGKAFTLTSLGRDGKEGGEGYDADIQGSFQN